MTEATFDQLTEAQRTHAENFFHADPNAYTYLIDSNGNVTSRRRLTTPQR